MVSHITTLLGKAAVIIAAAFLFLSCEFEEGECPDGTEEFRGVYSERVICFPEEEE